MASNERNDGFYPKSVHDSSLVRRAATLNEEAEDGVRANMDQRMEQTFPSKLHYMLDHGLEENEKSIVTWQPHGRAFLVLDQARFVAELLPNWFRQNKYQSFQRQLNSYGFQRITQGRDKGAYYHMRFLRGRPELCPLIKRVKIKGNGGRKPSNPETEPNFYIFPPVPPSPQGDGLRSMSKLPASRTLLGIGKVETSFMSLHSSPPIPQDYPIVRLPASDTHPESASASTSFLLPVDERKPQGQNSARMLFSKVKNGVQPQWLQPTHPLLARSTFEAGQSVSSLPGVSYAQSSTIGAEAPPVSAISSLLASSQDELQRSLMLEYSRRLEGEAQAIERERRLLSLLARQQSSLLAAMTTDPAAIVQGLAPSYPSTNVPRPTNLSLMRMLQRETNTQQSEEGEDKRGQN